MRRECFLVGAMLMVMCGVVVAGKPRGFVFTKEGDFSKGSFEGVVVDSRGRLMVGREMGRVEMDGGEMVAAIVEAEGGVYAAVNPGANAGGKIFRIEGKKGTELFAGKKEDGEITALCADGKGGLLAGFSGKKGKVVRVGASGKLEGTVFEDAEAGYVWAIVRAADGTVYVGTGPEGRVYRAAEGKGEVVLETSAKNVMSLGFDGKGNLIAGTDGNGLVIRVDVKGKKGFVLLDAGKVDVTALVTGKDGAIYVATAKGDGEARGGSGDGGKDADPETKSKPGTVEPERAEPGDGGARGVSMEGFVLGANKDEEELRKLIGKAVAADKGREATQPKKDPLTRKSGRRPPPRGRGVEPEEQGEGSCVYWISAEGAVTTLVQSEDMNYSLALAGEDLVIGTGNEGKLWRYRLGDESLALVARLKEEHVTAVMAGKDGEILVGTANLGAVYRMGAGTAKTGTFTSQVLDAGSTANWGRVGIAGAGGLPKGVKVETRSGNLRRVEGGNEKMWSEWKEAEGEKIGSPAARYVQVRVTVSAEAAVDGLKVSYQTENLPPRVRKVEVTLSRGGSEGDDVNDAEDLSGDAETREKPAQISWDATDPNGDAMVYRLMYRAVGLKEDVWTPLTKDVRETVYEWDTRGVADGRYEVKVMASDRVDNGGGEAKEGARVSGVFTLDHTPPAVGELKAVVEGNKVKVSGEAKDATSAVIDVRFQVDGQGDWQLAAASDKIFDSAQEGFTLVTGSLGVGGHRITVRAMDAAGNYAYRTATVVVK